VPQRKLYDHVRGAAGSLSEAARRIANRPEPGPERRWRRVPVLVVALGIGVLVRAMHREQQSRST
jgi:hypothetical protein